MEDYKEFKTPQEVEEWVAKHYTKDELWEFDCLRNEKSPVGDYKGGLYNHMNRCLWLVGIEEYNEYSAQDLQKALMQHTIPEGITVTRFVSLKEWLALVKNTMFHKEYVYRSFLSTTLLRDHYSMDNIKRGRLAIRIYVPAGTNGMYLPEVNPASPEFEILLPCNMKLKRTGLFSFVI